MMIHWDLIDVGYIYIIIQARMHLFSSYKSCFCGEILIMFVMIVGCWIWGEMTGKRWKKNAKLKGSKQPHGKMKKMKISCSRRVARPCKPMLHGRDTCTAVQSQLARSCNTADGDKEREKGVTRGAKQVGTKGTF